MMKDIKKEARQSSLMNSEIRRAGFESYESTKAEGFKNSEAYNILNKIQPKLDNLKRLVNSIMQKPRLWASFVDWKTLRQDSSSWIVEAFIEGAIANWWTHKILGWEFGVGMIIAHGFLIKQGLDLYKRLKQNGANKSIPTKDKHS